MGNADAGKKLRAKQADNNATSTQEALASKGTQTKESVEIKQLKEKLSNANSIIKDKDALLADNDVDIDSYKKEIKTLNAMLEQCRKAKRS